MLHPIDTIYHNPIVLTSGEIPETCRSTARRVLQLKLPINDLAATVTFQMAFSLCCNERKIVITFHNASMS